ncbi:MAG: (2Fe-2S)-binding protein [Pirellulaceae bacterium]
MQADDELCLCFHVSWRKVINYIRIHHVRVPSQLAECQSAGTGCGWCRGAMRRLVERMGDTPPDAEDLENWLREEYPAKATYAAARQQYIADGRGTPPTA